ncbi:4-diphosphocytidyl-2C-methyl-D-erythritol kinase [Brachybacterium vulturis]|uniref:4-diphosphocytidyl-2C-methyl-D-erythritol kinase n=1 Tax=Brachybacterium vulturis TaxID=2017484 RepID=A0A291GQB1_9MICO|nr:2-C-methyl-D-erythritol 4-phosphate cytidylyltransferase [Brachybacterium vulturis]ATG52663.1 4-diphosphocytidyl-2C-methyl-D-erythritol kinase [Brachybacterium vulturis]
MSSTSRPITVRPIILALAPPAPGLPRGAATPCLERLGGSRLIDRLLGTLHGSGLPAPLVITGEAAHAELRTSLGRSLPVIRVAGGREAALRAALDRCEEELLLLHDAERALTPSSVVRDVLGALQQDDDAVVPVITMTDSVKEVRPDGLRNIDRSTLAGLQSPRLVRRGMLESVVLTGGEAPEDAGGFDEIRAALEHGARVRTVHGSHAGFAVLDRLSLWQAQISLGLARDTSHRHGLARRS